MLRKLILPALFILLTPDIVKSQAPEKSLENLRNNYEIEKIYLHFDKENYIAGETIWFKAYLMAGFYPSHYSSTLFVSFLNDSGRTIKELFLPVIRTAAAGNFELSPELAQGRYTVIAYTKRLMNFGSAYFYNKSIPVFNPLTPVPASPAPSTTTRLDFMPEGGAMVAGINNIVAFKGADAYGHPVSVEGEIKNSKGVLFATFESVHNGMGKFQINPEAGETYYADVIINKTIKTKVDLPKVKISGIGFRVLTAGNKILFSINSEKVASEIMAPHFLLAVMENEIVFKKELPATGNVVGTIPLDSMPSGILQLTIFTKDQQPLAERLVFVNTGDYLAKGELRLDTLSLASRGKNRFSFFMPDTLSGTFSVSVTDADKVISGSGEENILSRMLLSNGIHGYVHEPAYYFSSKESKVTSAMDLVMLTHGWRRYNWDQVLYNRLPAMLKKDDEFITIKGKAYNDFSKKLLKNTSLSGFVKLRDSAEDFMTLPIDALGNFEMKGLIFQDTISFTFQNADPKNRATFLDIQTTPVSHGYNMLSPFDPGMVRPFDLALTGKADHIRTAYNDLVREGKRKAITLANIQLAAASARRRAQAVEDRYRTNNLYSGGVHTAIDFISDPPRSNLSMNIFEYLKGRLSSVNITGSVGNYFLNFRSARTLTGGPIPMAIFLDEMQVTTQQLSTVRLGDVAMVKVLGTGFAGISGTGGALAVYLKKGVDLANGANFGGMKTVKLIGYSPTKEFYSPDYSAMDNLQVEDNRTTLYWDPYLETDATNRKIIIPFYNADKTGNLRIVLTGTTEDGKFLHVDRIIK